jgi:SAM-dependent methyltransferase
MHPTARSNARLFFDTYLRELGAAKVLEIGSQDVNGSLRDIAPPSVEYVGIDFAEGKGVDVALKDPYRLPFDDESFDAVASSSCLEHSELFWLTFLEALRVLKPHGLLYINAPSNGVFHRYPVDCWRFYPDAGRALVTWARRSGFAAALLESYIGVQRDDIWNDFVAVFLKDESQSSLYPNRIIQSFCDFENGILNGNEEVLRGADHPEDMRLAAKLRSELARDAEKFSQQLEDLRKIFDEALAEKEQDNKELQAALAQKQEALAQGEKVNKELQAALAQKEEALAQKEEALAQKEEALAQKEEALAQKEEALAQGEQDNKELQAALAHSERLIAYMSNRYASSIRERKLEGLRLRLWLSVQRLPVRPSLYALIRNSPLFDRQYYLAANPDVQSAGIDPVIHYVAHGSREGRDPSPCFSETGYMALNPDAVARGLSAVEHYERGRAEGGAVLFRPRPHSPPDPSDNDSAFR